MEINALHQENRDSLSAAGNELPDISRIKKTDVRGTLSQVGMQSIEMPILFKLNDQSVPILLPAKMSAFVSLDDPEAKGIHMSRLYLELKNIMPRTPLSVGLLKEVLNKFLQTHEDLSRSAFLEIRFQIPVERSALISGELGYRQYPVYLKVSQTAQGFQCTMGTEVLYSSTCPCSAALARQLIQEAFAEKFAASQVLTKGAVLNWLGQEDSIVAVPHSQRSLARVLLQITENSDLDFVALIDRLEGALKTPVQAAVKRVDEQEFARLNGQNLMFCEDAARRLQGEFVKDSKVLDYYIHVEHQESLHPHEAVSRVVKGVPGGFVAEALPAL